MRALVSYSSRARTRDLAVLALGVRFCTRTKTYHENMSLTSSGLILRTTRKCCSRRDSHTAARNRLRPWSRAPARTSHFRSSSAPTPRCTMPRSTIPAVVRISFAILFENTGVECLSSRYNTLGACASDIACCVGVDGTGGFGFRSGESQ